MEDERTTVVNDVSITHLGHASFMIAFKEWVIYIDPFVIDDEPRKADLILITHDHYDHWANIKKLRKSATQVIGRCPEAEKIDEYEERDLGWVKIKALPAYNIGKPFHPRGRGVGFLITINDIRIYHTGDSDLIPEMKGINADIVLLPIGGKYTMNADDAIKFVEMNVPSVVIPMHYNSSQYGVAGIETDPYNFKTRVEALKLGTDVRVI